MAEDSGPLFNQNFRDDTWRSIFGAEPGITGDVDGTAYAIALPPGSDSALLGSPTQDSVSVVAGFMHKIAQGQTHAVPLPPATDATTGRTDIVAVRYDPARFEVPGPCNLVRIPGVEGSAALPPYDGGPPGAEDFPLWAVTRKAGQALNQATVVDLRVRTGPNLLVPTGATLPADAPLGTRAERDGIGYLRELVNGTREWTPRYQPIRGQRSTYRMARGTSSEGEWQSNPAGATRYLQGANQSTVAGPAGHVQRVAGADTSVGDQIRILTDGLYRIDWEIGATAAGEWDLDYWMSYGGTSVPGAGGTASPYRSTRDAGVLRTGLSDERYLLAGTTIRCGLTSATAHRVFWWEARIVRTAS